jgi:aminoglycoside phosphotransferase (APT) family kinase protein
MSAVMSPGASGAERDADASMLLPGGVSSDIRLVEYDGHRFCVKQALPKLKVQADWRAPVERNHSEAEWLRVAAGIVPNAVPRVLYEDQRHGWFVMEYLSANDHPVWKTLLHDGVIDPSFAAAVGRSLAEIHARTAGDGDIAQRFATDHIFYPIRPEPYLITTARSHPDLALQLHRLSDVTMRTRRALVHGDVSPKNILCGPHGPVFLDAECAWYGDPAFDIAFVLNHMLLKGVWHPQWSDRYVACFDALAAAYLKRVDWEPVTGLEQRAAHLLPGLLLGRIDGKSPVEYIVEEDDKQMVRDVARALLRDPVDALAAVRDAWIVAMRVRGARGVRNTGDIADIGDVGDTP